MQEKDENGYIRVATTIKHFPFVTVIKDSQPASVMISYASIDRGPMSANRFMMRTILREKLGFDGVLMSDAEAILHLYTQSKVVKSLENAALRALKAGLQLELSPAQPAAFPTLLSSINSTLVRERIDDAVLKILVIKFQTGLFDEGLPQVADAKAVLKSDAHLAINHNMSRESIVLLQNDGILPLRKGINGSWPKTAVIGPFADIINPGSYVPNNSIDRSFGKSLYQSMATAFGSDRQSSCWDLCQSSPPIHSLISAQMVNFFAHADLGFPGRQQDLLNEILATGVPTVLILSGGQAFVLDDQTRQSNSILHSFLGGEYTADSLVEILIGDVNPSNKLTISVPQSTGAIPIYYNYLPSDNQGGPGVFASGNFSTAWQFPELPRTPPTMAFEYGLGYTTFECSNAQTSSGDSVQVTVDVQNTGNVTGKEVMQLYFRLGFSVTEFPVKKLIRFEKVELAPGESITVNFTVPTCDLGYYRNMEWEVETGAYNFWVGSSSLDHDLISLNTTVL
ncbi:hypothetical protein EIK77_007902 [Talaromyces pinophilus]|nr:hypothetical protein EIK77_007902 [Talaromyces pinophilus]